MSLVLGLEHSCPWPRECLSSERLSLALASDFFCVLGLGLEPCVLDSTSAKDQGHRRKCSPKKKDINFFFQAISKKRSSQIFRKVSGVFQRNFYDSKNSAVLGRGQGNFRRFVGFEAKVFKMCPRGLHL